MLDAIGLIGDAIHNVPGPLAAAKASTSGGAEEVARPDWRVRVRIGTAATIAYAVYHATGERIRSLPITVDKLLQ